MPKVLRCITKTNKNYELSKYLSFTKKNRKLWKSLSTLTTTNLWYLRRWRRCSALDCQRLLVVRVSGTGLHWNPRLLRTILLANDNGDRRIRWPNKSGNRDVLGREGLADNGVILQPLNNLVIRRDSATSHRPPRVQDPTVECCPRKRFL